jgi:hypothetical protein
MARTTSRQRDKNVVAAIVTAIGTIIATVLTLLATQFSDEGSSGSTASAPAAAPSASSAAPAGDGPSAPSSSSSDGSGRALSPFVFSDGSGVAICGTGFPKAQRLNFYWLTYAQEGDGSVLKRFAFHDSSAGHVVAEGDKGVFYSVGDHLPHDLPAATAWVRVEVTWQGGSMTSKPLAYDKDNHIDRSNTGPERCPW